MAVRWTWAGKGCLLLALCAAAYVLLDLSASALGGGPERGLQARAAPGAGARDPSRPLYEKPPAEPGALGEGGRASRLRLGPAELREQRDLLERYALNVYVSDRISLHRRIEDRRLPECRARAFDYARLPSASVVIAFYNEAWSTLLRTVHSVLETAPAALLREVILVDDGSDRAHLRGPLEAYVSRLRRVRLVRTRRREGLVRARLLGAAAATADVLTFLDCHCECSPGWLEPLLQRVAEDPTAVVCPVIDTIDWDTFEYHMQTGEPVIGGFDWRLAFQWRPVPRRERLRRRARADPIRSPTMAGGLFAVARRYFGRLGTYDAGMEVWGGENLELSFRVWQCGGRLEVHPCSHVGHVFPRRAPYARPHFLRNSARAAEVWLDAFKEHFYSRTPPARREPLGDLAPRHGLRRALGCRGFAWYLRRVFPELRVPEDRPGWHGAVRSVGLASECLDYSAPGHDPTAANLTLFGCHGQGGNQFCEYTTRREMRFNAAAELCADVRAAAAAAAPVVVGMRACPDDGAPVPESMLWDFRPDGTVLHPRSGLCLSAFRTPQGRADVQLRTCEPGARNQMWKFEK